MGDDEVEYWKTEYENLQATYQDLSSSSKLVEEQLEKELAREQAKLHKLIDENKALQQRVNQSTPSSALPTPDPHLLQQIRTLQTENEQLQQRIQRLLEQQQQSQTQASPLPSSTASANREHEEENHRLTTALDTANSQILVLTGTLKKLTKQYTETHKDLEHIELENQELRAITKAATTDAEAIRIRERQLREDAIHQRRNTEHANTKIKELHERIETLTKELKFQQHNNSIRSSSSNNNSGTPTTVTNNPVSPNTLPASVRKTPKGAKTTPQAMKMTTLPAFVTSTKAPSTVGKTGSGTGVFLTRTEANLEQKVQNLQKRIQDLEKEKEEKDSKIQELVEQLQSSHTNSNYSSTDNDNGAEKYSTASTEYHDTLPSDPSKNSTIPPNYGIPLLAHLRAVQATLEEIKLLADRRKQKRTGSPKNPGNNEETNGTVTISPATTPRTVNKIGSTNASSPPSSLRYTEDLTTFLPSEETMNHLQSAIDIAVEGSDPASREGAVAAVEAYFNSLSSGTVVASTPPDTAPANDALQRENISLLSTVAKIRNNITVFCRIRPLLANESLNNPSIWPPQSPLIVSDTNVPSITMTDQPIDARLSSSLASSHASVEALSDTDIGYWDRHHRTWRPFAFDHCYGPEASQDDIYRDSAPFIYSVLEGYTSCVVAYGTTGSGKTHTMQGPVNDTGLNGRLVKKLFALLKERAALLPGAGDAATSIPFSVRISMLEVYNDEIRDLLLPSTIPPVKLEIRTQDTDTVNDNCSSASSSKTVVIPGLTSVPIGSYQDALIVFAKGYSTRAVAGTGYNEYSSRSHCIIRIDVESNIGTTGYSSFTTGRLYLVDLAGSERVPKTSLDGLRLRETQYINRSLAALGDVMEALEKKQTYIPYRNSKLTHILQDALGGSSSRALIICNVSPSLPSADETLHTLQFAARARTITLGTSQKLVSQRNIFEALARAKQEITKVEHQHDILRKEKEDALRQRNEALHKLDAILGPESRNTSPSSSPNGPKSPGVTNTQEQAHRALIAKLDTTTAALSSARTELANLRRLFGVTESLEGGHQRIPENSPTRVSPSRSTVPPTIVATEALKKKEARLYAVAERERRIAAVQGANDQREIASLRTQLADAKASLAYLRKQHAYTRTRHGDKERMLQLEAIVAREPEQILQTASKTGIVIPYDGTDTCPTCGHHPEEERAADNGKNDEEEENADKNEAPADENTDNTEGSGNPILPSESTNNIPKGTEPNNVPGELIDEFHDHSDLPPINNNVLMENDLPPQKIDFSPVDATASSGSQRIRPSLRSVANAVRTANRFAGSANEKRAQREAEAEAIRKAVEEAEAHAREELRKAAKARLRLAGNTVLATLAFGKPNPSASSLVARTGMVPLPDASFGNANNSNEPVMSVTPIPTDTMIIPPIDPDTVTGIEPGTTDTETIDRVIPVAVFTVSTAADGDLTVTATPVDHTNANRVPLSEEPVRETQLPIVPKTMTVENGTSAVPVKTESSDAAVVPSSSDVTTQKLKDVLSRMGGTDSSEGDDNENTKTKASHWSTIRKYTPDIVVATRAGYVFGGDDDEEEQRENDKPVTAAPTSTIATTTKPVTTDTETSSYVPSSVTVPKTKTTASAGVSALASASLDFGDDDDDDLDASKNKQGKDNDDVSLGSADTDDLLDLLPE